MLKEMVEYLVGLRRPEIKEVNGEVYADKSMVKVEMPYTTCDIGVRSLSGLVDYIKSEFDAKEQVMVHVVSPTKVVAFGALNENKNRNRYIEASAFVPEFRFDNFYDTESLNIKLQSVFVQNEDRDILLKVVGNIVEEDVKTIGDDGISQSVVGKTGVASREAVKVPNPVTLRPYRTFVEIKQPASNFVFRMRTGPAAALFEADGGAWKLEAMRCIERYLNVNLKNEIENGSVFVIA